MMQKQNIILAIVGLPGAGKTTASKYLYEKNKKNLSIIQFGKIVNDYIDQHKLKHTTETHKKIWLSLREKYGQEAFAILNEDKIRKALERDPVIIDGMRSWEEYKYLKNKFPNTNIYIITIYADKNLRYSRSAKRKYRVKLFGEDRDIGELIWMNMGPTIAFADFMVVNNSSLKDFQKNLDGVFQKVMPK